MRIIIVLLSLIVVQDFTWGQASVKKLKPGDSLPHIVFSSMINAPKPAISISELKGKYTIIDFWAPWCMPCIEAFPKIDSIRKQYADKMQLLLITKEDKESSQAIIDRLKKRPGFSLTSSVVEDQNFSKYFEPRAIPYYVWVNPNGKIAAITGSNKLTKENIELFLSGAELDITTEVKIGESDFGIPWFTGRIPTADHIVINSALTKYISGINAMMNTKKNFVRFTNHSIARLYEMAFGNFSLKYFHTNSLILENFKTKIDSFSVGVYDSNSRKMWRDQYIFDNIYNYELSVGDTTISRKLMVEFMVQDLNRIFGLKGISGRKELRRSPVVALTRISDVDKLKTKGEKAKQIKTALSLEIKNLGVSALLENLRIILSGQNLKTLIDETGYKGRIDIEFDFTGKQNIETLNAKLAKYDLKLVEKEADQEVIILTKK